jgi:iron complex transport system substrate-binding protein
MKIMGTPSLQNCGNSKALKLNLALAISLFLLLFSLFCGELPADEGRRSVIDGRGRVTELPETVTKVAPTIGAFVQMTEMLTLGGGKVAAYPLANVSDYFLEIFPDLKESNPEGYDSSSAEDILASGAQVVFGPDARLSDDERDRLERAGVKVVAINGLSTTEELCSSFLMIGEILGPEELERANEFAKYYKNSLAWPRERTKDLKDNEKPKVLSLNSIGGALGTVNKNDILEEYINAAGGVNPASNYLSGGGGMSLRLDPESVILWDPDIILTNSSVTKKEIMENPAFKGLSAIKNDKVFIIPYGAYLWSVRSGEGAMMTPWLGKTIHPELFKDIDMKEIVADFYKRFYAHEPSGEELDLILAGTQNIGLTVKREGRREKRREEKP